MTICQHVRKDITENDKRFMVSQVGRTVRTFRDAIDIEEAKWKPFRRTLKPAYRENLSKIFEYARSCVDAGTMISTPRITEVVLVATMIEMLQELKELKEQVKHLEGKKGMA